MRAEFVDLAALERDAERIAARFFELERAGVLDGSGERLSVLMTDSGVLGRDLARLGTAADVAEVAPLGERCAANAERVTAALVALGQAKEVESARLAFAAALPEEAAR